MYISNFYFSLMFLYLYVAPWVTSANTNETHFISNGARPSSGRS